MSDGPAYDMRILRGDSLVRRVRRAVEPRPATRELAGAEAADDRTLGAGPRTCTMDHV